MSKRVKVSAEDFQNDIGFIIDDCIQFADGEMQDKRRRATDYYHAEALGNEEEGRSQFVVSEVRDAVLGVIPSVMRIIFGAENAVEFAPTSAGKTDQAEQVTDYIQHVFSEINGGFMQTYSVLKDGLIRKIGIFKYWWDDTSKMSHHKIVDLPESQLEMLIQEEGVEVTRVEEKTPAKPPTQPVLDAQGQPTSPPQPGAEATYDIEFTHTMTSGMARVESVPPEEFIFNREARSNTEAMFVGHRTRKTQGELLAMGVKMADIEEHGGDDNRLLMGADAIARANTIDATMPDPVTGEANEKHLYVEGYTHYDFDGDGIAELRRVCTIGIKHFVVVNEPADEARFAIFCPDPEPHTMVGQSWADRTMDLQRVKSMLTRSMLDSLALSIYPRVAYIEGEANVSDILNTEIGAPIRMRSAAAVTPFVHEFAGREAFPLLDYFDSISEKRTGRSRSGAALDADALQSSTKAAVGAAIDASQEQNELLARLFAEGTMKPLFRGLMRLFVKHQPKASTIRLRGKWIDIDPREWDADMDVVVKVALGSSMKEGKIAVLTELAAEQKEILSAMGPSNPVYSLAQLSNTRKKILNLQGFKDTAQFISDVDPNWQPPPQPPQETPEQTLAKATLQAEQMKTEKELTIKQAQFEFDKVKSDREFEMKEKQMQIDAELRRYEIELKYHAAVSQQALDSQQADMENDIEAIRAHAEHSLAADQQEHEQTLAEHAAMMEQQKHEQETQHADEAHQQEMAAPAEGATA